jgi:hypothetical protein
MSIPLRRDFGSRIGHTFFPLRWALFFIILKFLIAISFFDALGLQDPESKRESILVANHSGIKVGSTYDLHAWAMYLAYET